MGDFLARVAKEADFVEKSFDGRVGYAADEEAERNRYEAESKRNAPELAVNFCGREG